MEVRELEHFSSGFRSSTRKYSSCIYTRMHIYPHTGHSANARAHIHTHTQYTNSTHAHTHFLCARARMHTRTNTHTQSHTQTHTYTHTHTQEVSFVLQFTTTESCFSCRFLAIKIFGLFEISSFERCKFVPGRILKFAVLLNVVFVLICGNM